MTVVSAVVAASKRQLLSALREGGGCLIKADAASASINRHKLYVAPYIIIIKMS